MPIDIEGLLAPVDEEAPCGADPSYDPEFLEMERLAKGTVEQQIGDTIVEAEEPDWKAVCQEALGVLGKSKHLWAIIHLLWAEIRTEGIPGLRDGLALLAGALEQHWASIHPELDPEDSYDPMERLNLLRELAPPAEMQAAPRIFDLLLSTPLCDYPVLHRSFCLQDIRIAKGEAEVPADAKGQPPDDQLLTAAFCGAKLPPDRAAELQEQAQATAAAAGEAAELVAKIDTLMVGYVGAGQLDLSALQAMLEETQARITEYLAQGGIGEPAGEPVGGGEAGGGVPAAVGGGGQAITGDIRSNEDVRRVLDMICTYYEHAEPSSPVPLLLKRAKRLVGTSFVEIIQDMNPDGLRTIEVISGPLETPDQQQY